VKPDKIKPPCGQLLFQINRCSVYTGYFNKDFNIPGLMQARQLKSGGIKIVFVVTDIP
jgi:hypothetical protein